MKTANVFNLDDEQECSDFLKGYGHLHGVRLARALGLSGRGSVLAATYLENYARCKRLASLNRIEGNIQSALEYERSCDSIYMRLPEALRW